MYYTQLTNEEYHSITKAEMAAPEWNEGSGISPNELKEECFKLWREGDAAKRSRMLIKTDMCCAVLEKARIAVEPMDIFADLINVDRVTAQVRAEWIDNVRRKKAEHTLLRHSAAQRALVYTGDMDFGHIAPDWNAVLSLGLTGLRERVSVAREAYIESNGKLTKEAEEFYNSADAIYGSAIVFVRRLAAEARRKAEKGNVLSGLADCLDALGEREPRTLYEALELIFIFYRIQQHIEVTALRSLGGLDRLLIGFYENDLANGKSEESLRQLLRCFMLRFNAMKVLANIPFYIAGRLLDGRGGVNRLSYAIVEEYMAINVHDPKIHVRYYPGMPKEFLSLVMESIRSGRNSFVFLSDDAVGNALVSVGESAEDSRNYVVIGCYEPAALGKEAPCTCNGRVSLPKALELVLNGGFDTYAGAQIVPYTGDLEKITTFEKLFETVCKVIRFCARGARELVCEYEKYYTEMHQSPFLSATFSACLEKGKDIYAGGAVYNNSSINAISIASAADALVAVKRAVYDEKLITLSDLAELLRNNWAGGELLRKKILNKYPKYGNGNKEADGIAARLAECVAGEINNKPNGRGGVFRCGFFTIDWRIPFGKRTGATADGRLAGEPLSKNLCAVTAMDREGVTAHIRSVTAIDSKLMPNGAVLDLVLHSSAVNGDDGIEAMLAILHTYAELGGFALQFNVLDPSVLRAAQAEPEKYATLQVRLCGWNVYFTALSKTEQDDFIRQSEHVAE